MVPDLGKQGTWHKSLSGKQFGWILRLIWAGHRWLRMLLWLSKVFVDLENAVAVKLGLSMNEVEERMVYKVINLHVPRNINRPASFPLC